MTPDKTIYAVEDENGVRHAHQFDTTEVRSYPDEAQPWIIFCDDHLDSILTVWRGARGLARVTCLRCLVRARSS